MTHAVTRILSFLILAFFLALGSHGVLLFGLVLTASLYYYSPLADNTKLLRTILRMKWFFFSILLVYLFINAAHASFTSQLFEGLKRILILLMIMLQVSWLMNKTPREEIVSALIFLSSPLKFLGFPTHKFALRLELVLRHIDEVQALVAFKGDKLSKGKKKTSQIAQLVSGSYFEMIDLSESKALNPVEIRLNNSIQTEQWLAPLSIFCMTLFLHQL